MRRLSFLATLAVCISLFGMSAPALAAPSSYLWHTFYGSDVSDRSYGIAVDSEDCSIIVGRSHASWTGSHGEAPLHDYAPGGDNMADIFILKLDSDGKYLWHTFYGTDTSAMYAEPADYGMGVVVDEDDNIYVTGFSAGTWNGPTGQAPKHAYSGGMADAYVLKLDSAGGYKWHTFYGSGTSSAELRDEGHAISLDGSGNIYVAMQTGQTWNGPAAEPPINPYAGDKDLAVLKLTGDGDYVWHTFYGSAAGTDDPSSICATSTGVYVSAQSTESWDGGSGPLHAYSGGKDTVVLKLTGDGDYVWHTFYGSAASDGPNGIVVRGSSIYVAGYGAASWDGPDSESPLNAYAGECDVMVMKLNTSGAYGWHTFYGSAGANDFGLLPALDDSGTRVCVVGRSHGDWTAAGSDPVHAYTGDADLLLLELDRSGEYQWHTFYGSTSEELGQHVALNSEGIIYATGASKATFDGDDGADPLHEYSGDQETYVLALGDPAEEEEEPEEEEEAVEEEQDKHERRIEPASLGVSYLVVDPEQALPGQEVTVSANVCNSGGERGSRTATLSVNGAVELSQSVGVSAGSCQQVVFNVSRAVPGTYQVSIDGVSGYFSVVAPRTVANVIPSQQSSGLGTAGIVAIAAVVLVLIVALATLFRK